jgi:uncharacterized protein with ParB-like and HNH nuclease domain
LVIIDGQQRLTTINILYVALYRFAKENGNAQDAERLYNMFLTNQYVKNESSKLKLKQTDTNSLAFKAIMLGADSESSAFSNVTENYNYFRSIINEENFELILRGLNRLIFVEISLERDKDDTLTPNKFGVIFELQDVNLFNETDWKKMNDFFVLYLPKFESAIQPFIKNLK